MSIGRKVDAIECAGGEIIYQVGKPCHNGLVVKMIGEHAPAGPGDCWFYDVIMQDESIIRVFNMTRLFLTKPITMVAVPPLVGIKN